MRSLRLRLKILGSLFADFFQGGRALHQARFAHTHELVPLYDQSLDGPNLLLGEAEFGHIFRLRPTRKKRELGNMLVVGRTRSGKGLLAKSQILSWSGSLVINDIKGELFEATSGFRQSLGPVYVFDPTGVGHRFDPFLGRVSEDDLLSSAKSLLFERRDGENSIFTERAITMATQIFLAAVMENEPLLPYLRSMLFAGPVDTARHLNSLSERLNRFPNLATRFLDQRLEDMERRHFDDKFFASAWSTLTHRLNPLLTQTLLRSLSGSDFTAEDILKGKEEGAFGRGVGRPVTLYLRWPERALSALSPLVRLLWGSLIDEMLHIFDTASDKFSFLPVLLLVDEAGRSPVPMLADYITTVAGRGITIWMAIQSLSQLQTEYGASRAETIRDNCDTQLFYRPANHDGAHRLREWLGNASGFARSRTLREGVEAAEGEHEQAVPLLSEQEIKLMGDEETICFHSNLPPFRPKRMDFRRFPKLFKRTLIRPPEVPALPELDQQILPPSTDLTNEVIFVNPEEYMG